MSRRNENDWATILGGIAQLAIVGGAAYTIYKAREAFIDQLLTQPTDEAVQLLIREVPQMDNDTWDNFFKYFHHKAETSDYALNLLSFAIDVHKISVSIEQLLTKPLSHAHAVLSSTVQFMDDATWNIFEYVLIECAKSNLTARALLNHAVDVRNSTEHAEDLFRESIEAALADDLITAKEATELEKLRRDLNISPEVARNILVEVKTAKRAIREDGPLWNLITEESSLPTFST